MYIRSLDSSVSHTGIRLVIAAGSLVKWLMLLGMLGIMTGCLLDDKDVKLRNTKLQSAKAGDLTAVQNDAQFSLYLKNGLLAQINNPAQSTTTSFDGAGFNANSGSSYSGTNLQVNGVDEADRVKYDGNHLFVAQNPEVYWLWSTTANGSTANDEDYAKIRILSAENNTPSTQLVTEYSLSEPGLHISGLYLNDTEPHLSVIASSLPNYWTFDVWFQPWFWQDGRTSVHLLDVTSPANPSESFKLEIEGYFIDSRRIGNTLYVVTRYTPQINNLELIYNPQNNSDKLSNQQLIDALSLNDLLPQMRINDNTSQPLFTPSECYIPSATSLDEGYPTLITVSSIGLDTLSVESRCIGGYSDGIFASTTGIYLLATENKSTVLHKMLYQNSDVGYADTATVTGDLGWRNPSFRLDEFNGVLRVLSTEREFSDGFVPTMQLDHRLTLLTSPLQPGEQFSQLATLPNNDQPQAIGKPGEDIFAVRYVGNRGYAVTFQQTDPLYVFDLSDPNAPSIAGELEVTGFSEQLHPLGENFLLGIGYDSLDGFQQGAKVELFDVTDIENPQSVTSLILGKRGSYSEAANDHHAFSILDMGNEEFRLTLPLVRYQELPDGGDPNEPWQWYNWTDSGLHLFEINTGVTPSLAHTGAMIVEDNNSQEYPSSGWGNRSVIHGDAVHFVYDHQVWSADWNTPQLLSGPQ